MKQIIKRDGTRQKFDKMKIVDAVLAAFREVDGKETEYALIKAGNIADYIAEIAEKQELSIEEIQDLVEKGLMATKRKDVARAYIVYRNERTRMRGNTTDKTINEIVSNKNDYWSTENSNKNPKVVTTQRDYIAGAASTDLTRRLLLPQDVVRAHDEGILHFHDADYFAQNALTNCELVNLEDMLQNGTVINEVLIEKPHRILTASTIATQIILAVTSSTYGGCTISLTHLAPFVRDSFNIYYKKYQDYGLNDNDAYNLAQMDTKKEVEDAVQTFNYQINSFSTTNGQAPFVSVFMYIDENPEYKRETVMLIEEFLKQRIKGMKNRTGHYVTQAFPKLIYCLDEDNIHEDSEYYWLTELAVKSTAKRMNPDYVSAKIMKEYKSAVFPSMG